MRRVDSLEKTLMLEGLGAGGEGDNRGWDGWMASLTWWTWSLSELREVVMDRETWRSAIHGFTKSRTPLSDWTEQNCTQWSSGFSYFLQFKSEFGNKDFMIWATLSSWSYFCGLYRASPSLAAKNIINLISVLTIWWCPCVEPSLVLLEEGVCYDQCIFLAKLY